MICKKHMEFSIWHFHFFPLKDQKYFQVRFGEGGGSQEKKIKVSKMALEAFWLVAVNIMENDPAGPPPLHMENSICFLQIIFESFPYQLPLGCFTLFSLFKQHVTITLILSFPTLRQITARLAVWYSSFIILITGVTFSSLTITKITIIYPRSHANVDIPNLCPAASLG